MKRFEMDVNKMTRDDVNRFLTLVKVLYPNIFKTMNASEKMLMVETWSIELHDIPVGIVILAFFKCVSISKWPPTVAEIREQVRHIHYEAETMIQEARLIEEMDQIESCNSSETINAHMNRLKAIAENIYKQTDHLARGLYGTDCSLKLADILDSVTTNNGITGDIVIRELIDPMRLTDDENNYHR